MLQFEPWKTQASNEEYDSIFQQVSISADYRIQFTRDVFAVGNPILKDAICRQPGQRVACVCFVDSEVLRCHQALPERIRSYADSCGSLELLADPFTVPGGEACKNDPALLDDIYRIVRDLGIDRHSCIVAIGGGAVLDLVGYAAATAHRGIRLIRLPTTVLSQNDSGVGVKNGINYLDRKNFLGTFAPPDAVVCDFDFLASLADRDKRAGLAEAIKVGLIRDAAFFDWHEANCERLAAFDPRALAYSIRHGAEIHAMQISRGGDPFEKGSNRPLDFGHWLAHKLESLSAYRVRHGEAVAIGMLVDARYSLETGLLAMSEFLRIERLIKNLGFTLWHEALERRNERGERAVMSGIEEFREHLGGELSITLLEAIGSGREVHAIDAEKMERSLLWLRQYA